MITILSFFVQNERFWSRWIGNFPKFSSVSSKTTKMNCLVVKSKKTYETYISLFRFHEKYSLLQYSADKFVYKQIRVKTNDKQSSLIM